MHVCTLNEMHITEDDSANQKTGIIFTLKLLETSTFNMYHVYDTKKSIYIE